MCKYKQLYALFGEKQHLLSSRKAKRWSLTVDSFFFGGFFFGIYMYNIHVYYTWLFLNSDSITKTEFIALLKLDDRFRP